MMNDTTKKIEQLVEINRALAHDLDMSRRFIADIARERDGLRAEIATLTEKCEKAAANPNPAELEMVKQEWATQQRQLSKVTAQRQELVRETQSAIARADQAEQQLHGLLHRYYEMEKERDDFARQLKESTAAMSEIKDHLVQMPDSVLASVLW